MGRPDDDSGLSVLSPHNSRSGLDQVSLCSDAASPRNYRGLAQGCFVVHHRITQRLHDHHFLFTMDKLLRQVSRMVEDTRRVRRL